MHRRAFLTACGASLGLTAGCSAPSSRSPANSDTNTDTDRPNQSATESRSPAAAVSFYSYQPGILARTSPETLGVLSEEEKAYLFVLVDPATPDDPLAPSEFRFQFAGDSYSPEVSRSYFLGGGNEEIRQYDGQSSPGWLLFELPESGDASNARLTWPGDRWRPDETLRRRLSAKSPQLSMDFAVPQTIEVNTAPTVSVTIQNEGDLPGRFVGALTRSELDRAQIVVASTSMLVSAGGSTTWTYVDTDLAAVDVPNDRIGDDMPDVTYSLSSIPPGDTEEVRIVNGGN